MIHAFDDDTPGTSVVEAKYAFVWSGLQFGRVGVTTGPGRAGWYAPWDSSEGLDQLQWVTKYVGSWVDPGWAAMAWRNSSATVGYFPAGGLRLHESGAFASVSTNGYGWSSARSSGTAQDAHYLGFGSTGVYPSYSSHRTYGFPVRCVQEEVTSSLVGRLGIIIILIIFGTLEKILKIPVMTPTHIEHIGIAVENIQAALPYWEKTFGLKCYNIEEVADQKVRTAFLKIGDTKIELLEPTDPESAVAKYLEKKGPGFHHIAFAVENIEQALKDAEASGIQLIDSTPRMGAEGLTIAFLHPRSTGGVLTELCEDKNK